MKGTSIEGKDPHVRFQADLSCLLDGELDETAAARAMLHIEECTACREFFEDVRLQVRLHRDMRDPDRLFAQVAMLTGSLDMSAFEQDAEQIALVHRLATVFYQLGKSYILAAIDPDFRTRVFEAALPVEETQAGGRDFVDGILSSNKQRSGGLDWRNARGMLNGRLERIEQPLEKGRRLLQEALQADSTYDEARLYLAFLHSHEGKVLQAANEYRNVFNTAMLDANRGHAAMQLGKLHGREQNYKKSIACFRWVVSSGLEARDPRFFGARFNIGTAYAMLGRKDRALVEFRALLDHHPSQIGTIVRLFAGATRMQAAIDRVPGFPEALLETCPELFSQTSTDGGTRHD